MLRIANSYFLIAIVLICPQLCWGEAVGAAGGTGDAGGCCCAEHHDRSGGETPQSSDENGTDCLCQGAIMDGVRSTEFESLVPLVAPFVDDAILCSAALSLADASSEPPHHFPPLSTGRDICVLTCALLL